MSRAAELGRPFKPWAYLPKPLTGALLPARHPLARRPVIAPAELPGETMLVAPRAVDAALHNRLVRDLEAAGGRALRAAGDPPALAAKLGLVAAGLGSAPVPRSAARWAPSGTVFRPLAGVAVPFRLDLAWRSGEANPAVLRLIEAARRAWGDTAPPS